LAQGAYVFNPFTTTVKKNPTRTVEAYNELDVPTKEGLTVKSEISLLYHVKPEAAREVYTKYGMNYQEVIVETNFRSWPVILRVILCQRLFAVDRKKIEKEIFDELAAGITDKGFVLDAVFAEKHYNAAQIFQAVENKLNLSKSRSRWNM